MKVFGKVQKKKRKEKKIESFKLDMCANAAAALAHTLCSHQHNVVNHSFLLAVPRVARRHVKDRVSNWGASFSSSSVTKRVTASHLEAIAGLWYVFSKLAARPSLKTPARRLLDVTVARRTCASRNIGKEEGVPRWNQCWRLWARQVPRQRGFIRSLGVSLPERSRSFKAVTGTPPAKQRRVSANRA